MPETARLTLCPWCLSHPKLPSISYIFSNFNNRVLSTVPPQKAGQVKASMPECYTAAPDVWPGSFMSACSGTVLPLSFPEEIQTLERISIAENANAKGSRKASCLPLQKEKQGPFTRGGCVVMSRPHVSRNRRCPVLQWNELERSRHYHVCGGTWLCCYVTATCIKEQTLSCITVE